MGQVTIYLDDEVEKKMNDAVKSAQISKSKWIAQIIQEKVANDWPLPVVELAGSWKDFPDINELRGNLSPDIPRENL